MHPAGFLDCAEPVAAWFLAGDTSKEGCRRLLTVHYCQQRHIWLRQVKKSIH